VQHPHPDRPTRPDRTDYLRGDLYPHGHSADRSADRDCGATNDNIDCHARAISHRDRDFDLDADGHAD
jgi:hypothetical protein